MKAGELFSDKVLTISNFLSLFRILVVPLIGFLMWKEHVTGDDIYKYYELIVMIIGISTDFFDGYLARLLNQETKLGRFLDPLADKIAAITILLLLYMFKDFPMWIIIVTLVREIWMVAAGMFLFYKRDVVVQPNFYGKASTTCVAIAVIIYILSPQISAYGITIKDLSNLSIMIFYFLSITVSFKTYSRYCFKKNEE